VTEEAPGSAAAPRLLTPIPGPASRALAARLSAVESRNITRVAADSPIFWSRASGAGVTDADGNVFIDLTAGFGVAFSGHANPRVVAAIEAQCRQLPHALGDVHPADVKVELLEALAERAPGALGVSILGSAGAEAVEAALKTALLRTGRPGVLAFRGAYHGLTLGALAVTHRADFREPFLPWIHPHVRFVPWPAEDEDPAAAGDAVDAALHAAERAGMPVGAVIAEPILGRGGLAVPPAGFLRALRERCDGQRTLLILDEIYTGLGRTGRWFACQQEDVVPDILVVGKALAGGLPLSAAIGTADVMDAWPPSTGEAIHTSTFLGNPVACAAAVAQLRCIAEDGLVERARTLGHRVRRRVEAWAERFPGLRPAGRGLLAGVRVPAGGPVPGALEIARRLLPLGYIALAEGPGADVLAITPPAVIEDAQLEAALDAIEALLGGAAPARPATSSSIPGLGP
jgi:4-aminobutyrate aminotransferase-like enzyme